MGGPYDLQTYPYLEMGFKETIKLNEAIRVAL